MVMLQLTMMRATFLIQFLLIWIYFSFGSALKPLKSTWPQLATGVEGAILYQDSSFKITARRWDISEGQPVDPSKDYQYSPGSFGNTFGHLKYFFPVSNNGQEGCVWQDINTRKIFLSWFSTDLLKVSNIELPTNGMSKPKLQAAAGNGKGEVCGRAERCGLCCVLSVLLQ